MFALVISGILVKLVVQLGDGVTCMPEVFEAGGFGDFQESVLGKSYRQPV